MHTTRRSVLLTGLVGAGTLAAGPAWAASDAAQGSVTFVSPADGDHITAPTVELRVRPEGVEPTAVTVAVAKDATTYPERTLPLTAQDDGTYATTWTVPEGWDDGRARTLKATAYGNGSTVSTQIRVTFGTAPVEPAGTIDDFEHYEHDEDVAAAYEQSGTSVTLSTLQHASGTVGLAVAYETSENAEASIRKDLPSTASDWSGSRSLALWVRGDGSENLLAVDVQAGDQWYRRVVGLSSRRGRQVSFPFARLRKIDEHGNRAQGTLAEADRSHVQAIRFAFVGEGAGTVYLDQIRAE